MRLTHTDHNNKFELEEYPSSKIVHKYLSKYKKTGVELSKIAIQGKYAGQGVVKRMWLAVFKYCEAHRLSVICTTHNGYLKNMFKRIGFPLILEHAFKYELSDPLPVNLYIADSTKNISEMVYALECLDGDLSPNSSKIFKALELVAPILPVSTYWHDTDGVVLGVNEHCLNRIGSSYQNIVGKSPYEFYPEHTAEHIVSHNNKVIRSGEIMAQEEWIEDITTGSPKCFLSTKAPLYDDEGKIIGVIGSFVEVTGEKDAEKLRLENQAHQTAAEEQEKFRKIVGQMLHDIQSPLTGLDTLIETASSTLPEETRIQMRHAVASIGDMTRNMLSGYSKNSENDQSKEEKAVPLLVSMALLQALSAKRFEYQKNTNIQFKTAFEKTGDFTFINIDATLFQRMISNLINNAVYAVKDKADGVVEIGLTATKKTLVITVEDNGPGMPKHIQELFKQGKSVSEGKKDGHALGLTQVYDTVTQYGGEVDVLASAQNGTYIVLKFPVISSSNWLATDIKITVDDLLVIVDDDKSIHAAWDSKFKPIIQKSPSIKVKHFAQGADVIAFLQSLTEEQKQNTLLLTDYELIGQNLNGLDIIERAEMTRAVLVTSHASKPEIQEYIINAGIKGLPKELVSLVPILVDKKLIPESRKVDMVWVDDRMDFIQPIIDAYYKDLVIDTYTDPRVFMEEVIQYPKDTRIILDTTFYDEVNDDIFFGFDGLILASKLHKMGFTNLILYSGAKDGEFTIPDYLKYVSKFDFEAKKTLHKI
jgi:PAS domain S-box-containing protein